MNIYLYQNNTEKVLKNIYIGEYTIPTDGLLGYRPLQSDLLDASGNGKDGSWYSGTGSFSTIGGKTGAVVTNNVSGYSTQHIVTTLNYTGPTITMCGWIYYTNLGSYSWNGVMTNSTSGINYIVLGDRPGQSNKWSTGGYNNLLTVDSQASTGTWFFVCGVLSSSGKKIYVNGSIAGSDSTGFTTTQGGIWRLGCGQIGSGSSYGGTNGYIRHCAVYNRELSTDEISTFYTLTQ